MVMLVPPAEDPAEGETLVTVGGKDFKNGNIFPIKYSP